MTNLPETIYGLILDDEGSCDYYDTAREAYEYSRDGQLLVKVVTSRVDCICYSTADPWCEIHGH